VRTALTLILSIGAGLIGGVFFAFSVFVMKALAQLPAEQGVRAMQRINVVVLESAFLAVFIGTTLVAGACAIVAVSAWSGLQSQLLLIASVAYGLGAFGVTLRMNVPRNQRLAQLDPSSQAAADYWPVYVREWVWWNHVRTAASIIAAACAAIALRV
jgi:uncharacterized membrane protein